MRREKNGTRGKKEHNGETINRGKDCKRDRKKQIESGSGTKVRTEEQKTYYSYLKIAIFKLCSESIRVIDACTKRYDCEVPTIVIRECNT